MEINTTGTFLTQALDRMYKLRTNLQPGESSHSQDFWGRNTPGPSPPNIHLPARISWGRPVFLAVRHPSGQLLFRRGGIVPWLQGCGFGTGGCFPALGWWSQADLSACTSPRELLRAAQAARCLQKPEILKRCCFAVNFILGALKKGGRGRCGGDGRSDPSALCRKDKRKWVFLPKARLGWRYLISAF